MPHRDDAPIGAPCWVELSTSDIERAREFYGEVLGWGSLPPNADMGGYVNFTRGDDKIAGGIAAQPGAPANVWLTYLATSDARATVNAVGAAGGTVVMPAMDVMDLGVMAIVSDPGGATIGIWQPGTHRGFTRLAEPGAPAWFELRTPAYDASVEFYRSAFGWDTEAMSITPEFRYTTQGRDGAETAGIMDAAAYFPEGAPGEWSIYFAVENTDDSLAKIVSLGGSILEPAQDSPYGRLARAADPMGAQFKLMSNSSQG